MKKSERKKKTAFSADTAGHKMNTAFPRAHLKDKVSDIEKTLKENVESFESLDYVYIVDENDVLQGIVSIKDVLNVVNRNVTIEKVMEKKVVTVGPRTHQERVVYLALSHGLKAIPVVNSKRKLLGIIPYDTILHIFNEEVREDIFKFGGIFHKVGKEYTTIRSPATTMIMRRLPWLIIGVLGGAITASIVSSFEEVLSVLLALASFTPVLAYLSDAAGTQSETVTVRSLALDPHLSLKPYFLREFKVALTISSTCGLIISIISLIGWKNPVLSLIVGCSMIMSMFTAIFVSTTLPFVFKKMNLDPAFATGPFATLISDIATITIYFGVATIFLSQFGLI